MWSYRFFIILSCTRDPFRDPLPFFGDVKMGRRGAIAILYLPAQYAAAPDSVCQALTRGFVANTGMSRFDTSLIPFELWSRIFSINLYSSEPTSAEFHLLLLNLASICSFLRGVVRASPGFWTGVTLDRTTSECRIQTLLDLSCEQPLDAVLDLDACGTISPERFWDIFGPSLNRCRSLVVRVFDADSLELLAAQLNDAVLYRLVSFSFSIHNDITDSFPMPKPLDNFLSSALPMHPPRIVTIPFTWIKNQSLRGLTSLAITDVLWLTWAEWQCIASTAPSLKCLRIWNVGCSCAPIDPDSSILFSALEDLDCFFGPRTPRLTTLRFRGTTPGDMIVLSRSAAIIVRVRHLVLYGVPKDNSCYILFGSLVNLESLELLQDNTMILSGIVEGDRRLSRCIPPQGPVCPHLSTLRVSESTFADIREFMIRRGPAVRAIDRVVFDFASRRRLFHPLDRQCNQGHRTNQDALQWLRERTRVEILE
ncbi:hypothetical protein C8F04DRAFT_1192337 [Mycena alexandri]|uniref:F-box domain-containing protein n=1 Tax=Mycena alexandri TaxID=1745969 RepID=A0AAD6SB70_9AGAR|nr:hypothetical protein C8F04DRAFT_1192337 [Mycena alexandri]